MSNAKALEFGLGLDAASLSYSDLTGYLEDSLARARCLRDVECLIKVLNPALKDSRYTTDERHELKKLRQRAYDRRRNAKFQTAEATPTNCSAPNSKSGRISNEPDTKEDKLDGVVAHPGEGQHPPLDLKNGRVDGSMALGAEHASLELTQRSVSTPSEDKPTTWTEEKYSATSIHRKPLVVRLPAMLLLLGSTFLVIGFLWLQSVDLYKAIGYSQPELTAAGGLLMVVGFAGIQSLARSRLAVLLCLYAASYEGYFMVAATVQDEQLRHRTQVDADSELRFLHEKLDRTRTAYSAARARYEKEGSDVYMNSWFKKTLLDPAWRDLEAAQGATQSRLHLLTTTSSQMNITALKVFYRLGLVLLSMILVHQLCRTARNYG